MPAVDAQALQEAQARLQARQIDVVRLGYSDLVGAERGKDLLVRHFARTAGDGVAFCRSVHGTSPLGDVVDIEGGLSAGLPDMLAIPDLATVREIPWEPGAAHMIADLADPGGGPGEESPRHVLRRVADEFATLGMRPMVGPELEFFVLEQSPGGWRRYGEGPGHVYTAGYRGDPDNLLIDWLRQLDAYGLEVVSANHEFASGQFEINLWHSDALDAADRTFRFRTAVQELARRDGKRATFMAKPFNDEGGSGFHVHFSCWSPGGEALFDDPAGEDGLSGVARSAVAGLLAHAPALAALLSPTITSYKRFGPGTLAPWLIDWGLDNRSALVRIPPERGRGARLELRLGDASANPYVGIAAVLAAAALGLRDKLEPPAKLEGYGYDVTKAARLPGDLGSALSALEADTELTELLGPRFVAAFLAYKRDELERFSRWVTDWEFREYAQHQ
ncbi:glutamine synthetase [Paractinoplanes abujensis]|uniref:Glutamine synthetase n=2 Tax=Paractinoplanes abujensis TaxID=882441 RepID=A0A7W7CPI2_9ACTN|nr:glutamine synthetase [Actinoplanes abujensis]GID24153.1 glutamine synthetase [Actinoplanes abujensis]